MYVCGIYECRGGGVYAGVYVGWYVCVGGRYSRISWKNIEKSIIMFAYHEESAVRVNMVNV